MPKGYWIAHVTVTDPEQYKQYVAATPEVFQQYGAKVLARGGRYTQFEGKDAPRNVVIEFPTYEDACNCYSSAGYQAAKAKRKGAGEAAIVIVEGV